tara:strand:- start:105 stop:356 length:252 start_codon:yes stop_codon:yes gene_type:complete
MSNIAADPPAKADLSKEPSSNAKRNVNQIPIRNTPVLRIGVARLKIRSSYMLSLEEIIFNTGPRNINLEIKVATILAPIPIRI